MSEENVEVLRRLYASWERGDFDTRDCFDAEVEHRRIGSELPGISGSWQGLEQLGAATANYFGGLDELQIEAEEIIDLGGDRVLVLSRHTARGKSSGLHFDHELADLFTLRDGKIVRYYSYWDRAEGLEAAGLSKDGSD